MGTRTVIFRGKEIEVKFTPESLYKYELAFGAGPHSEKFQGMLLRSCVQLLWGGLLHKFPDLQVKEVEEDLFSRMKASPISDVLNEVNSICLDALLYAMRGDIKSGQDDNEEEKKI